MRAWRQPSFAVPRWRANNTGMTAPRSTTVRARIGLFLGLLGVLAVASCRDAPSSSAAPVDADGPVRAVVSIAPLAWVFDGLPASIVEVHVVVPTGATPHGFEMRPSDRAAIAVADVVSTVGLGIDGSVESVIDAEPRERRRHVSFQVAAGIESDGHAHHHHHDHAHDHDCGDTDPHLWLDPVLMRTYVEVAATEIRSALAARRDAGVPGAWDDAIATFDDLIADRLAACDAVAEAYSSQLTPHKGKAIITYHGAFRRIVERYGLKEGAVLRPIEAVEPTLGGLADAAMVMQRESIGAVFTEPQFPKDGPERLATMTGAQVLELDPIGRDGEAWDDMMMRNLDALVQGLELTGQ